MANMHPYTTTKGGLVQTINRFRQSFPKAVDSTTLKKLGFAPNNESYVLNVLRFLGLIDDEGKKTTAAGDVFNLVDDAGFSGAFASLVKTSYRELFDLHQDTAWHLDTTSLIAFFRANDGTTATVGKLQASTFQLLAAFAGYGEVPEPKSTGTKSTAKSLSGNKKTVKVKGVPARTGGKLQATSSSEPPSVGLTVRIEVNLPADADQRTYDRIFKSIKENLLNG